jgi:tRNA-specific 2-thiouridylase
MSRICVGMSGGLDSSAAAWLLQREGHEVIGVTFTAWKEEGSRKCCSIEEITRAGSVCRALGIPHRVIDAKDLFGAKIVPDFIESYRRGLTPNPCVLCNRYVKFGALLEYALSEGADFAATGHYVRTVEIEGETLFARPADLKKDQTYFLCEVEPDRLPYLRFPLGAYTKDEVRALIDGAGLPITSRATESQDICFVPDDYRDFLRAQGVPEEPGDLVYRDRVVGRHPGIAFTGFGQRRGLGVAVGERVFVTGFDPATRRVFLGDKPSASRFRLDALNVFSRRFGDGMWDAQVRYLSPAVASDVALTEGGAVVTLSKRVDLVTPGQYCALYRDGVLYAGGRIAELLD